VAYRLEIERSVPKMMRSYPDHVQRRLMLAIRDLAQEPRPDGCKKLKATEHWAVRVGNYRIVYRIDDAAQVVTVLRALHRREAYRDL
jgi:mRNA interferase RelE/StbE